MAVFNYVPSYSTDITKKPKTLTARFGDGYAQRARDGINNNPQVWSIKFEGVTSAVADAITAFIDDKGGTTPFQWTPPGMAQANFICEEGYQRSYGGYNWETITMKFEQDFAP